MPGQQAAFIAQRALELRDEGVSLNQIAVLYRSHFHALELQLELTRRQIPFSITSGIRFFEQAHIKDATAFLKFIVNPRDEISFKGSTLLLPGIGEKGADKIWQIFLGASRGNEAPAGNTPAPSAVPSEPAEPASFNIARSLQSCAKSVPKKAAMAWAQFVATISQLEDAAIAPERGQNVAAGD